jgi:uncharacterized membrane protein (UPF0127 family)
MNRNIFLALVIALMMAGGVWRFSPVLRAESGPPVEDLVIQSQDGKRHVFKVEIADTEQEAELGLMYRKSMPEDHGMLFEFPAPQAASFWMKNTFIPLDIVFVDQSGRIATIAADAAPESLAPIPSRVAVAGAIEINGGLAAKLGLKPGDMVIHPFFRKAGSP